MQVFDFKRDMVAQALHVAEDTRSNMFFTVKDLSTGNCTAFVQTEQGISHPSNIGGLLEDQVVHKYSGVYKGSSRNLQVRCTFTTTVSAKMSIGARAVMSECACWISERLKTPHC